MFLRSLFCTGILGILLLQPAAPRAQAQTQASCKFKLFKPKISGGVISGGVNDWGTVVGSLNGKAAIRYANGVISYYSPPGASSSLFSARNNSGVTVGNYWDAKGNEHAFMLRGSTLTPIVHPKAVAYTTSVRGVNRWNTIVGSYTDSSGTVHGFKRYSNGSIMDLDDPANTLSIPHGTFPLAINDSGVVVGSYSADLSATGLLGFVYHNGKWATLNAGDQYTLLYGISNAGVIVAFTGGQSYLYANGTFKLINVPNSVMTEVDGMAPGGLISGRTAYLYGFTATCH
jgi:hypothetical protein